MSKILRISSNKILAKRVIKQNYFYAAAAFHAKTRTPFEFVAAALRAMNADTDADRPVLDWIARMGEPIFGKLTPDGYADTADEWLSSNDLLARINFTNALANNKIKGTRVDFSQILAATDLTDSSAVAARLLTLTFDNLESDATKSVLLKAAREADTSKTKEAAFVQIKNDDKTPAFLPEIIVLALGSRDFQLR
jgi:hypothetical protein